MEESKSESKQDSPKRTNKRGTKLFRRVGLRGLFILVLIVAIASAVVFYQKYQDSQYKLKHPEIVAQAAKDSLVEKVSRHVAVPQGEKPTIATVSDVSKLSSQAFFTNAQNGDKVLIYTKSNRAILYRPSSDRVIDMSHLSASTSTTP